MQSHWEKHFLLPPCDPVWETEQLKELLHLDLTNWTWVLQIGFHSYTKNAYM